MKLDCTVVNLVSILEMMVSTVVRMGCRLGWMENRMDSMGCTLDLKDYILE